MRTRTTTVTVTTVFDILDERGTPDSWLARQLGVSRSYITKIRSGDRPIPDWFVERTPKLFGVPPYILFPELEPELETSATS